MNPTSPAIEPKPWKVVLLIFMTAVIGGLIWFHVTGINGPDYWRWLWRRSRWEAYLALLAAAMPLGIAQARFSLARASSAAPGIMLMMVTVLGVEIADRGMDLSPFQLTRIGSIIEEPGTTGYFTHAEEFTQSGESVHDFLRDYVKKMPTFTMHARNKPPGSILFYVPFLRIAPTWDQAALAAGLFIALLATLSVPATYLTVIELTGDRLAAYAAAGCMSLCPGLVLFLPEFDQFYPVYSAAMVILWARALRTGKWGYAAAFGVVFALICFQTFNLLMMGVFLAGYAGLFAWKDSRRWSIVARQAGLFLLAFAAVYAVLWIWCGYDPVRTLITGIKDHSQDVPGTYRTWPRTVPFDLTDFALGTGWVGALLAVYCFVSGGATRMVWLCVAEPVAVALVGLLQGETARVWVFMIPLLLVPAGLELSRWPPRGRLAALGCLWVLMALLSQNMVFV